MGQSTVFNARLLENLLFNLKILVLNGRNTQKGIAIISRFPNSKVDGEKHGMNLVGAETGSVGVGIKNNRIVHDSMRFAQRTSKPAIQPPKPYSAFRQA